MSSTLLRFDLKNKLGFLPTRYKKRTSEEPKIPVQFSSVSSLVKFLQ